MVPWVLKGVAARAVTGRHTHTHRRQDVYLPPTHVVRVTQMKAM